MKYAQIPLLSNKTPGPDCLRTFIHILLNFRLPNFTKVHFVAGTIHWIGCLLVRSCIYFIKRNT